MSSLVEKLPRLGELGHVMSVKKKTTLLNQGNICQKVFLIEEGTIRSWFNNDGDDVTFQFFFSGDVATSFESLKTELPALYNIETLTDCRLRVLTRQELVVLLDQDKELKDAIDDYIVERLYHYQALFISRISNSPQERYTELLETQPDIFDNVAHHYIATYLGITPVSLSRIRAKNR